MQRLTLFFIISAFMLVGCQDQDAELAKAVARPVKTMVIGTAESGGIRNFPAVVDTSKRADLSFRVDGKLNKLLVNEGDDVVQGQVLAELDPTDFQIVVNDRQANFNQARADYNRAKQLVGKGHISRMDYDRLEADYKSRLAALNKAKQDLSYTVLKAPFTGTVAKRFFQKHEEITFNEVVFALRDNSLLEIKVNVPEKIMLRITDEDNGDDISVRASFDSVQGQKFPLIFKEVSTRADPTTQTFLATYTMPAPKGLQVLPGMTATVTADLSQHLAGDQEEVHYLPISAVTGDAKLESTIWIVDEKTMTVHSSPVKLGTMKGGKVEVLEGINGRERVVTAGAGYMADGMKIILMKPSEQAKPRPEDVRLSIGK